MVVATACANIALVKYWGKRSLQNNLPETDSLAVTLDALRTFTEVGLIEEPVDRLLLDGDRVEGRALDRVSRFLDRVAPEGPKRSRAAVMSINTFPASSGLASSASGFAALAVAAARTYGLALSAEDLSRLARLGSGSAARSIHGGWVRMNRGTREDGSDAFATPVTKIGVGLVACIALVRVGEKEISSRDGMGRTAATSPYHRAWLETVSRDIEAAQSALGSGDLASLAEIVEGNCLAMHADAMAARPGIIYFRAPTLWAIEQVRQMRAEGLPVMFTIDAGPHLVALTPLAHADQVAERLQAHPQIERVIHSAVGGPARLIEQLPSQGGQ